MENTKSAIAQQQREELEADLKSFEEQYQMSSSEFERRFHAGELGDSANFVEWDAFYQMWVSGTRRIKLTKNT